MYFIAKHFKYLKYKLIVNFDLILQDLKESIF